MEPKRGDKFTERTKLLDGTVYVRKDEEEEDDDAATASPDCLSVCLDIIHHP